MAVPDGRATRDLITGIILICGRSMHTLIDSGSTISFISGRMVDTLGLHTVRAARPLVLSTAAGDRLYPNLVCERCTVTIEGYDLPIELRVVEFLEFDALLSMD